MSPYDEEVLSRAQQIREALRAKEAAKTTGSQTAPQPVSRATPTTPESTAIKKPTSSSALRGAALAGIATDSAIDSFSRPTEDYYRRLNMDPSDVGKSILRDLGVRTVGVLSDYGAKILDTPVNLANTVYKALGGSGEISLPGGSFTEILQRYDKGEPQNSVTRANSANGSALSKAPTARANSANGSALSKAPTAPTGTTSDALPSIPPVEGVIVRQGNTYSGVNVGPNAPMVDSAGRIVSPRGGFAVLDESAKREYIQSVLQGAKQTRPATERSTTNGLDFGWVVRQLQRQPGEPSYRYRARTSALNEAVQNFINRENSIRNAETLRRGQDMESQGRLLPKQLELEQAQRLRALQGEFFQAAGGDSRKAAALAASAGMPELAKSFYDLAEGAQKYSQGTSKTALESLKSHATPDEKGNITEAEEAKLRRRVESAVPGYLNMSENERLAYQPEADGTLSLLRGINARRNHRLSQAIGLDAPDPEFDRLPDLRDGKLGEVGFFEGLFTPQVQRGDYYVELPNDRKIYVERDSLTENARELLKKRGVSTSALRD